MKKLITFILVFILFSIFVIYFVNKDINKPEDVLKQYIAYINEQKYEEMYEFLSPESKNEISKDLFLTRNKNIYEGIEAKNLKVKTIAKEEGKLFYQVEMDTIAGQITSSYEMDIIKKDKKYYINWNSNLIFPELNNDDKVRVETISGNRGKILDRNGKILAHQGTIQIVGFVPGKIKNKKSAIENASKLLGVTKEFINEELNASYVQEETFVPIKTLSNADEEKIEKELLEIPGIMISSEKARVYPYEEATSHLIGYIRNITEEELKENNNKGYTVNSEIGKSGIEKIFEDTLRGYNGYEIYIEDSYGNKKITIAKIEKKNGNDVKLTIDINLQNKAYEELKKDNGLAVAINPKTGEVLAMVSTPTYNSNDFIVGFTNKEWDNLNNNENNPMFCRYQSTFVPGSTLKPIIGAIGLTNGKMTASEDYGKSGLSWQDNKNWGEYKVSTLIEYNGPANLKNALIYSDNIFFAKTALRIGKDTLSKELLRIGFDKRIDFEQNMTLSEFAINNTFSSEIQLADTGYGQGKVLVNPLHMASMYSAFVNEGNMIKPYIKYNKETIPTYWIENAFSKEAANEIKQDLIQVVENPNGTAYGAKIQGMKIAGKTGTAEIKVSQDDEEGTEIGWFNAFRITENRDEQLLIVSMVEDVKDRGGSHYLLPKVKNMLKN